MSVPGIAIVWPRRSRGHRLAGDEGWPVTIAHARAGSEQGIAVGQVGEGVDADGGDFELTVQGTPVERFDVFELMNEPQAAGVELVVGERVEHERIVRIRAMPDADRCQLAITHQSHSSGCLTLGSIWTSNHPDAWRKVEPQKSLRRVAPPTDKGFSRWAEPTLRLTISPSICKDFCGSTWPTLATPNILCSSRVGYHNWSVVSFQLSIVLRFRPLQCLARRRILGGWLAGVPCANHRRLCDWPFLSSNRVGERGGSRRAATAPLPPSGLRIPLPNVLLACSPDSLDRIRVRLGRSSPAEG